MRNQFLSDNHIRICFPRRHKPLLRGMNRPLLLPSGKFSVAQQTVSLGSGSSEEFIVLRPRDIPVIPGMDHRQSESLLGVPHDICDAIRRVPLIHDEPVEEARKRGYKYKRSKDGDDSKDAVSPDQGGQVSKSSEENNAGKFDPFSGVHLAYATSYGCSEAMAKDDDATCRNASDICCPLDQCRRISD